MQIDEKHPKELVTTSNENNPGHQRETIAESQVKGCVNEKGNATKDNPVKARRGDAKRSKF